MHRGRWSWGVPYADAEVFFTECVARNERDLYGVERKFVLVTTKSDATGPVSHYWRGGEDRIKALLNHRLLAHWYSEMSDVEHERHTRLPMGSEFHYYTGRSLLPLEPEERKAKNAKNIELTQLYLDGLDLSALFPHTRTPLALGRKGVAWEEHLVRGLGYNMSETTWVSLEDLPPRVTTIYITAPLVEGNAAAPLRENWMSEVRIYKEPVGGFTSSVAFLPFPAALYHQLLQHPYGSPNRSLRVAVEGVNEKGNCRWEASTGPPPPAELLACDKEWKRALREYTFAGPPAMESAKVWEALHLGAIPIVYHEKAAPSSSLAKYSLAAAERTMYEDLPVVIIQDISEVTAENLERWRDEIHAKMKQGKYKLEKLFAQHWMNKIVGHTN
eukprot:gene12793-biopygen9383